MATTTINRANFAVTDDDGSKTTGTPFDNAWYVALADEIDAIISGTRADPLEFGKGIGVKQGQKLFFDAGGGAHTHISEAVDTQLDVTVGNALQIRITGTEARFQQDLWIPAAKRIYLDGGGDSWIRETAANVVDHSAGGTVILRLDSAGVKPNVLSTTASAANLFASAAGQAILRSTSSRRYKTMVRPVDGEWMERLRRLRPVTFRSTASADDPTRTHVGLVAEEVAAVAPELVQFSADGTPDGVQYDRLAVLLLAVWQQEVQAHG